MKRSQIETRSSRRGIRATAWLVSALTASAYGCSCEETAAAIDGGSDAGVFFAGIDAADYAPTDSGPRPPEPCDAPMRRVRFPVGDGMSGGWGELWGHGSRVWATLRGDTPGSVHLFDLDAERELDIDFTLGEGERLIGVFPSPTGYELIVRIGDEGLMSVVHVGPDGRSTGADDEPLGLSSGPQARLDDGRYATVAPHEALATAEPARIELASPSGSVEHVELGFRTQIGHVIAVAWTGEALVGIGYEDEANRVVRFELDPDSGAVRLSGLIEGVRIAGLGGLGNVLASTGDTVTAAFEHRPIDDASGSTTTAELFWWSLGDEAVTRHAVRAPSTLRARILALGGAMPLQTLVLAQGSGSTTWLTAARIRAPGDVIGGSVPLAVGTSSTAATAWQPSAGTVALAVLAQHELETLYFCEGAP